MHDNHLLSSFTTTVKIPWVYFIVNFSTFPNLLSAISCLTCSFQSYVVCGFGYFFNVLTTANKFWFIKQFQNHGLLGAFSSCEWTLCRGALHSAHIHTWVLILCLRMFFQVFADSCFFLRVTMMSRSRSSNSRSLSSNAVRRDAEIKKQMHIYRENLHSVCR